MLCPIIHIVVNFCLIYPLLIARLNSKKLKTIVARCRSNIFQVDSQQF